MLAILVGFNKQRVSDETLADVFLHLKSIQKEVDATGTIIDLRARLQERRNFNLSIQKVPLNNKL